MIITFLTEFAILISGILVYKLAANLFGKDGFSEYALSRRIVSFIQPILLVGLGVGIPRYIAYNRNDIEKSNSYFISGFIMLLFILLAFVTLLNLFREEFSFLLFGDSKYYNFIFPISLMLIGLQLHQISYSYFRGNLLMTKANLLQIINIGIAPLLSFILGKSVQDVLYITGIICVFTSLAFLVFIFSKIRLENKINKAPLFINSQSKELLIYGIQRVPGDFSMTAILTLPAIFTVHIAGATAGGYVSFGISLLNMIGAIFAPIGLIMLPKASQIFANRDLNQLKYIVVKLLKVTLFFTLTGVIVYEILADWLIYLYLGKGYNDLISTTRIIMLGGIGYTVYVSLRSIIDACYVKSVNTLNILYTLSLFLILSGIVILLKGNYIYLEASFVVALSFLGSLTLLEIKKLLRRKNEW